ncbi:endonuclease MutS2 [Fodinisporobacter ferrooxydans]|uniref:Endonuclease MutS2 n=1 Tax=Fodinisporobacter ferrooxydans TaxID=2901836 RepID=A0ABY4CQZ8_9BACL|nr:endonuclease MutS2 [Alicyclobacillaceae bacterium MYW30-H2]
MNDHVLRTLEYNKVLEHVIKQTTNAVGKELAQSIKPVTDLVQIQKWLQETEEAATLYRIKGTIPLGGIHDVRNCVKRVRVGGRLTIEELLQVADTIGNGRRLKRLIRKSAEEAEIPLLLEFADSMYDLKDLEDEIRRCIDENGTVNNDASTTLRNIRYEIQEKQGRMKDKLDEILRSPHYQKMLQDPIVTLRNERYCIPVKADYRGAFPGIIHDQSASGATYFIEPAAIVQMNNQLREKILEEQREIERILQQLSNRMAMEADEVSKNLETLGYLDCVFAKAKVAHQMRAIQPKLVDTGQIVLKKARHPLLNQESAVPISLHFGDDYTLLVITGPNTGGKTVTLKTIGLLTLMAMSGLFVPADDGTQISIFHHVFADIGDEQSIEQNLSTFSSHMSNIVRILNQVDQKSLVLLDELGAGTDPTEGAALAMSILDRLYQQGVRTVATTHYSELKAYAYGHEGAMNASVEFDVESLRPTYRLLIGIPGRSNAFAIAKRLGLHEDIIELAKSKLTQEDTKVEDLIRQLEVARLHAERDEQASAILKRETEQLRKQLDSERQSWYQERDALLQKAQDEAHRAVKRAQQEAQSILQELRDVAKQEHANIKEHRLIELQTRLKQASPELVKQPRIRVSKSNAKKTVKPGDTVMFLSLGQKAQVVEVSGKDITIQIGAMKTKTTLDQVELLGSASGSQEKRNLGMMKRSTLMVGMELDIRGRIVDDAVAEIDKYLDNAVMNGYPRVSIIHGKGTGALRTGVREFLRHHPHVSSFRYGSYNEGGDGVSIVELK